MAIQRDTEPARRPLGLAGPGRGAPLRAIVAGLALVGALTAFLLAAPSAPAKNCGDRYGQITNGRSPGVLILERRNVTCPTVRKLGYGVLKTSHFPFHLDGFACRYVPSDAGGGEARCTSGRRLVLFGFE